MPTDVHLDHLYECTADTFWDEVFFDEKYNEGLYREALRFPKYEQIVLEDRGATVYRKIRATPPQNAPAAIQKLMGGDFWYEEEATFDKESKRLRFKTVPSKLSEKILIEGTMRTEPAGEGKVRRIADITVTVKIFGIGGMVESYVAKTLKDSFNRGARYTNEFLAKKGLGK